MPKTKLKALDFGSWKDRPTSHFLILHLFKNITVHNRIWPVSILGNKKSITSEHFPEVSVKYHDVLLYSTLQGSVL